MLQGGGPRGGDGNAEELDARAGGTGPGHHLLHRHHRDGRLRARRVRHGHPRHFALQQHIRFPVPDTFTCIHLPHTCIHSLAQWYKLRYSCIFWQPTQMCVIYGDWRRLQTLQTLHNRYTTVTRPLQNRYTPLRRPRPGAVNVAPFQPMARPPWPPPPYPALPSATQPQPKLCPACPTPGTIQGSAYHRPGSSGSAISAHGGVGRRHGRMRHVCGSTQNPNIMDSDVVPAAS